MYKLSDKRDRDSNGDQHMLQRSPYGSMYTFNCYVLRCIEHFPCMLFVNKVQSINITEDHFEMKLIARLLNQIYVIQPPMLPMKYDDAPPDEYEYSQPHTSTDGARPSAPQFPEHLHLLLTHS